MVMLMDGAGVSNIEIIVTQFQAGEPVRRAPLSGQWGKRIRRGRFFFYDIIGHTAVRRGHARELGIAGRGGERQVGVSGEFGPMSGLEAGNVAGIAKIGRGHEWRVDRT